MKLTYSGKDFKILDEVNIKKSSREVTFNSIKIDFTNATIDDFPKKYQEVKIINGSEVLFTGFVNGTDISNIKNYGEFRTLEIDLLSPMALATKRTISAIGNYNLKDLINIIINPLIIDGFILKEININNIQLSVNYLIETIESSMNKLSNKYNFWWYIDEKKNIYINSFEYLFNLKPKLIYDEDNKYAGLIDIKPTIDAVDYCNVVDFTNVRIWQYSYVGTFIYQLIVDGEVVETKTYNLNKDKLFDITKVIKKDDEVTFNHPIDITTKNIVKSNNSNIDSDAISNFKYYALEMKYNNGSDKTMYIKTNRNGSALEISGDITFDENNPDNKDFILKRDSFFSNLIVGFKYVGTNNITSITNLISTSTLMWTRLKYNNLKEINSSKGIVSNSGIIEKLVDLKEQWKTFNELQDIATSYFKINGTQADIVEIGADEDVGIDIGDIVEINKQGFLINNKYIVTDSQFSNKGYNTKRYNYSLRNSNFLENYIDLFRSSETEELEAKTYNLTTINYEENSIREVYEVE